MELHKEILKKLCRVCAEKIKLTKSYVNAKTCDDYKNTLNLCYGIILPEDDEVFFFNFIFFICRSMYKLEI